MLKNVKKDATALPAPTRMTRAKLILREYKIKISLARRQWG